jgi:hypothetical protein
MYKTRPWLFGMVGLAALCLVVAWVTWPGPGISRSNSLHVRNGDDEATVVAAFGLPAGVHTSDGDNGAVSLLAENVVGVNMRKLWVADDGAICVDFNRDGRVIASSWVPRRQTVWGVIRRGLGL